MKINKSSLKELQSNLIYTHKIHEKESYISKLTLTILKIVSIAMLCISLFLQYDNARFPEHDSITLSITLTIAAVFIQIFGLSFGFEKKHEAHREAAKTGVELKNLLGVFIEEVDNHTVEERDQIVGRVNDFYRSAPQTGWLAKKMADRVNK